MTDASLLPGYRVLEPLGFGTLGRVFAGERESDGAPVALKFLHEDLAGDQPLRARFYAAANRAQNLQHPNLARILSVSEPGSEGDLLPHFAMERCPGGPLADHLRAPLLSIELVCRVGVGICQGLSAAHGAGIIHGDLKPSNVLVSWSRSGPSSVKLLDLGVSAHVFGHDDALRWASGTPRYVAPEVMLGREADERSDVYSTCALLYEMLGGARVVDADDDLEALKAAVAGRWRPLIEHNPLLPEPLVRAVESGLHHEPEKRLRSAAELLRQLQPYSALPLSEIDPEAHLTHMAHSLTPASTRLNRAPRPRSAATLPMRDLTLPVFPKSPATPNIEPVVGGASDLETLESEAPPPRSEAPEQHGMPVDLLVLGAGFGIGCVLVWLSF